MLNAQLQIQLSYVDNDGRPQTLKWTPCMCAYQRSLVASVPVPAGTAQGAEVDVPLSGLAGASFIFVENLTGQELNAAWGGNWAPHLADRGVMLYCMPAVPTDGKIASLRYMLTAAQAADGAINVYALGT